MQELRCQSALFVHGLERQRSCYPRQSLAHKGLYVRVFVLGCHIVHHAAKMHVYGRVHSRHRGIRPESPHSVPGELRGAEVRGDVRLHPSEGRSGQHAHLRHLVSFGVHVRVGEVLYRDEPVIVGSVVSVRHFEQQPVPRSAPRRSQRDAVQTVRPRPG